MPRTQRRAKKRNVFPGQKWCPHCQRFKAHDEFGFDHTRDDGLSGWCRQCRAVGEKGRRDADIDRARAEVRERYRENPDLHKAHVAVSRAVAAGRLIRPKTCPACLKERRIEAHHFRGYERKNWLEVVWLCRQCHALEHKRSEQHEHEAAA